MNDLWKYLATFGSGVFLSGFVFYIIFKNPDIVKKWISILYEFLSLFFEKYKYNAIKYSIESKINGYVDSLSDCSDIESTKVKIKWAGRNEEEKCFIEENEVVIIMRDREHKNKNIVHAAFFFTSNTLLWRTKRHISKKQSQALDIYTTKKIIEKENSSLLRIFLENYFQPLLEDPKVCELVKKFIEIDRSGFYSTILMSELSSLGYKTLMDAKDADVIIEVKNLIDFLYNFANREQGDDSVTDVYIGKYTRCSIKIVSTYFLRDKNNISSPTKRIIDTFSKGIENVYVIGPYDDGYDFINKVCQNIVKSNNDIIILNQKIFSGVIVKESKKIPKTTYFIHLQNPKAISYIVTKDMIHSIGELELANGENA